MQTSETDNEVMALALAEARKCEPKPTAFSVGCVLVARPGISTSVILATGYSRELEGNTHAEANALMKARAMSKEQLQSLFPNSIPGVTALDSLTMSDVFRITDVYTTMEPCSIRTSGLAPCVDAMIEANISRCIIGTSEPDDFVHCEGAKKLVDAGKKVIWCRIEVRIIHLVKIVMFG